MFAHLYMRLSVVMHDGVGDCRAQMRKNLRPQHGMGENLLWHHTLRTELVQLLFCWRSSHLRTLTSESVRDWTLRSSKESDGMNYCMWEGKVLFAYLVFMFFVARTKEEKETRAHTMPHKWIQWEKVAQRASLNEFWLHSSFVAVVVAKEIQ